MLYALKQAIYIDYHLSSSAWITCLLISEDFGVSCVFLSVAQVLAVSILLAAV